MRLICLLLAGGLVVSGCAHRAKDSAQAEKKAEKKAATKKEAKPKTLPAPVVSSHTVTNNNQIYTLVEQSAGKVYSVNQVSRFAILDYGLNPLPPVDQRLNVYRNGAKTGELKVTGPAMNSQIAADILAGDIQPGDETRRE